MESNKDLSKLCELSTTLDDAWRELYQGAFPEEEREPEDKLLALLKNGKLLLHKSIAVDGTLVCFTMVSIAPDFSFLAYMATNPNKRSGGYGSRHLKRLIEVLKAQFPMHIGMFLEIEATDPETILLSEAEQSIRRRRYAFYERAGAREMCADSVYVTPSKTDKSKEWEGELMVFEFGKPVCSHTLVRVVSEIYQRFYCLGLTDPLVQKVLTNFRNCPVHATSAPGNCCVEPSEPVVSDCTWYVKPRAAGLRALIHSLLATVWRVLRKLAGMSN